MLKIMGSVLALFGLFCVSALAEGAAPVKRPLKVLVLAGTPSGTDHAFFDALPMSSLIAETYLNPLALGDPGITGRLVRFEQRADWEKTIGRLNEYDVVVLWNAPARIIQRGETQDVLPLEWQKQLVNFVRKGGGLVVNGGLLNYGTANFIGLPNAVREAQFITNLVYVGYQGSLLAGLLPVEMPAGFTLELPKQPFRQSYASNQDYVVTGYAPAAHPVAAGLDWSSRSPTMAHYFTARSGADILMTGEFDNKKTRSLRPLIVGAKSGRGYVIALALSPEARPPRAEGPLFWADDPTLWQRLLRWAGGRRDEVGNPAIEKPVRDEFVRRHIAFKEEKAPLEWVRDSYPFSIRILEADDGSPFGQELAFQWFRDLGFPYLSTCPHKPAGIQTSLASADKVNVMLTVSLNPVDSKAKQSPEKFAQRLQDGTIANSYYGGPGPCPRNPFFRQIAADYARPYMEAAGAHPRLHSYMLDDEFGWDMAYAPGQGIGCYCEYCNDFYRQQAGGTNIPLPVFRAAGYVAPTNDPWMQWARVIRMNAYDPYQAGIAKLLKEKNPAIKVTGYPGGYFGGLDIINEEYYIDYHCLNDLTAAYRSDFRFATVGDMRGERHELWGMLCTLRRIEQDLQAGVAPETFRLQMGLMLGTGVQGIHVWASPWVTKCASEPFAEPLWRETRAQGDLLKIYGPLFQNLRRADAPVWMLGGWCHGNPHDSYYMIPFPDKKQQDANPEWIWSQYQAEDMAYPALMRAGIPVHGVTASMFMSDELFTKKAVVLPRLLFAEQVWLDRLQEFMRRGGKVFVDESAKVDLPGAIKLPVNLSGYFEDKNGGKFQGKVVADLRKNEDLLNGRIAEAIPVFRDQVLPLANAPVTLDSDWGAYTLMENGAAKYVFVYNTDKRRERDFAVRINLSAGAVYDLGLNPPNAPVAARQMANMKFKTGLLPAGGWKVYLVAPQALKELAGTVAIKADRLQAKLELKAADGSVFEAAVPLRIEFTRRQGAPVVNYRATQRGGAALDLPLGDYAGQITGVTITEMLNGTQAAAGK